MKTKSLPDRAYLKECFDYDALSGSLTWRARPLSHFNTKKGHSIFNSTRPGCSALLIHQIDEHTKRAYVRVKGGSYFAHRVIMHMLGHDIDGMEVDHKDGNPLNNRADNLRAATKSQNGMNTRVRKDSKSGLKGVSFYKRKRKWMYTIVVNRVRYKKYGFATAEAAATARALALPQYHGEFSRQDRRQGQAHQQGRER